MMYISQLFRIIAICFLAEILNFIIPIPVPSSIYGLVLLFIALKTGIYRLEEIRETGYFFINILTLLFVPSAVGIMEQWGQLQEMIIPCLIAIIPVTILVLFASGKVTQVIHRNKEKKENDRNSKLD